MTPTVQSLWHEGDTNSVDQPYQYVGQLGYYTHYQEPDFGLLDLGVRFYDPQTGRFTRRDPVQQEGMSDYLYVNGRCTMDTDPDGLAPRGKPHCSSKDRNAPPQCPAGQTRVFVTCYDSNDGTGGSWGSGAVYCENYKQAGCKCKNQGGYHQGLCNFGTRLSVPGYGDLTIRTCGCGQHTKNQPSPNNWIDLWYSNCGGFQSCWVCMQLASGCTPGGQHLP